MEELSVQPDDPSIKFGANDALWVYGMAVSVDGDANRTVGERAIDAVRTGMRMFNRSDVDEDIAVNALVRALGGYFEIPE